MEGFDRDWLIRSAARCYYTNLPGGHYRFHVLARGGRPGVTAERVLPVGGGALYQTGGSSRCALVLSRLSGVFIDCTSATSGNVCSCASRANPPGREMHDTLIQGCVGVSTLLKQLRRSACILRTHSSSRARNEVRAAVDEARLAVWDLRQSSGSGEDLVEAVAQLAQRISQETGIPVAFEKSGAPRALEAEGEWSLLMIIREALQNSVRHAAPTTLSVLLSFDRRNLRATVNDDGCGFDPEATNGHIGLIGAGTR